MASILMYSYFLFVLWYHEENEDIIVVHVFCILDDAEKDTKYMHRNVRQ